jgi:hypothetical protein
MIQRFNFYDIYGYFIPGLAVVVLLWLPYAVVSQHLPDTQLAVAALALAYVIGHVMQSIAANVFSAKLDRDQQGKPSYPSSVMLDSSDSRLAPELKRRIQVNVRAWFAIDVGIGAAIGDDKAREDTLKRRQAAFALCRLIVNARSAYAEQFEGLYVMMRGLSVAFGLSACYMAGWTLITLKADSTTVIARFGIGLCIVAAFTASLIRAGPPFGTKQREPIDRFLLGLLAAVFLASGYLLAAASSTPVPSGVLLAFAACILAYLAIALRFLVLYRYFAGEFAKAVWTSFAVEPRERPSKV